MSLLSPTPGFLRTEDGLQLRTWDYGGDGPTVLLAHCTGTHGRVWDPIVAALGGAYRCIALDARGHGDSDAPENAEAYAWSNSGKDWLCLADAWGLGRDLLAVGHSGGAAQLCFAEQMRPGFLRKAVLIDAIVGPPEWFPKPNSLADGARRRKAQFASSEEARARFSSKPPMNAWASESFNAYIAHGLKSDDHGGMRLKCPPFAEGYVFDHGGDPAVYEGLSAMKTTVLLITAEESGVKMLVEEQARQLQHTDIIELAKLSHFLPLEDPTAVALHVAAFLGSG